jgi:hypothetical protein
MYDLERNEIVFFKKTAERVHFFKNFLFQPSVMVPVNRLEIETKLEAYFTTWMMRYDPTKAEMRTKKDPHIWIPAMVFDLIG